MDVRKISDCIWEIPQTGKMNVPGRVFASDKLMDAIKGDRTLEQTANVATLPGIVGYSIAMPDAHQGYGFPVGGVAAFDVAEGIISPGGVGFDINCGVRLLSTPFMAKDITKVRSKLLEAILKRVPTGAGMNGKFKLSKDELRDVLERGTDWAKKQGFASKEDKQHTEEDGHMDGADSSLISDNALARGMPQLGTLGSGNHFLEVQQIERIALPEVATAFGIDNTGKVVVMIHCGSRGLGHQVCSDYITRIQKEQGTKHLADPELASAPIGSQLGIDYRKAMACAINFAFANRQCITHQIRDAFASVLGDGNLPVVYDVCHNIAKFEKHKIEGKTREVCVHRKGATRAFGAGRSEIPDVFRKIGQPVIIPGSMGTASYVLVGTATAEDIAFGSTAHGAGRIMSRHKAIDMFPADQVRSDLLKLGIEVRGAGKRGIAEEAPGAYKDIDEVARVSDKLGIGKIVARMTPLGVVKG